MREVPQVLHDRWLAGSFIGQSRNVVRATIQRGKLALYRHGDWDYASELFPQLSVPRELPNIVSCKWDRDTSTPAAECTLRLYNYRPLPIGVLPPAGYARIGQPGYYHPRRGQTALGLSRWGQVTNAWQSWLVYDRIIRTYEGYGCDANLPPELDPNLILTGVWLIDDVDFGVGSGQVGSSGGASGGSDDGVIQVHCTDLGRMLTDDNIFFPPVWPAKRFPARFNPYAILRGPDKVTVTGAGWSRPTYHDDSGHPYVGLDGSVWGHRGDDAFDGSTGSYWLSIGNGRPDADYSFEWVEGTPHTTTISAVKARVWGGPYRVYCSVKIGGVWQGHSEIPYNPRDPVSAPNGANIRFAMETSVVHEGTVTFHPKVPWTGVQRVRLTFTSLFDSGIGPYRYRAGVRDFQTTGSVTTRTHTHHPDPDGYKDWTDIVKRILALGGFLIPSDARKTKVAITGGQVVGYSAPKADPVLGYGRIWGDLMNAGTGPITAITPDTIDKQPLYTGIQIAQQTLGFVFYIDETGGAIFRMPNIFKLGNYVLGASTSHPHGAPPYSFRVESLAVVNNAGTPVPLRHLGFLPAGYTHLAPDSHGRTASYVTIDERVTLIGLHAKIDGHNVREKIFVGNLDGAGANPLNGSGGSGMNGIAAIAKGRNPYPAGFRRVSGWLDQHFQSVAECARMADLIALAQYVTIMSDTITVAGNPEIQIDDQIKVIEETTAEGGEFHHVNAIHSNNDMTQGWSYELDTNWLGENPNNPSRWIFDPKQFSTKTTTYLKGLTLL